MNLRIPFCDRVRVRIAEKVETVQDQYEIIDFGLEYKDGSIDSIAVGGSFHSLKKWTTPSSKDGDSASKDSNS